VDYYLPTGLMRSIALALLLVVGAFAQQAPPVQVGFYSESY
jgi:hypothetical protein